MGTWSEAIFTTPGLNQNEFWNHNVKEGLKSTREGFFLLMVPLKKWKLN